MSKAVLILGATSAIARATAVAFAARRHPIYLAGRDMDELPRIASDLHIRYGVEVRYGPFEAEDTSSHAAFLQQVIEDMNGLSGVVLAFGYLGDQLAARDFSVGAKVIASNFTHKFLFEKRNKLTFSKNYCHRIVICYLLDYFSFS